MIIESDDPSFIAKLTSIARSLKNQNVNDWSDDLPEDVLNELIQGSEEADSEDLILDPEQVQAIEDARKSLRENGGSSHQKVMARMKDKFPNAFRS